MITCPQCGAACKPTDKFCNSCGMLIASAAPAPAPGGMGAAPPAAPGGFGVAPAAPPFVAPPPAFGATPLAPRGPGNPATTPGGYGPQPPTYGAAPAYGAAPQQDAYGAPQPQFGSPFQAPAQAPPAPGGFGGPPAQGGFDGLPPQAGFGGPPPQAAFNAPAPFSPAAEAPLPPAFAVEAPAAAVTPATAAEVLRGFLVAYQSNPAGDFWPLHDGTHAVGRAGASDGLAIPLSDATISSKHARLEVDAASGTICVADAGSTNGTYVNDEHLGMNGRRELHDGDRVRFGGFTTIVKIIGRV